MEHFITRDFTGSILSDETVGPAAQTIDNEEKQSNAKSGSININLSGGGGKAATKADFS